jgi:hypothetical protein
MKGVGACVQPDVHRFQIDHRHGPILAARDPRKSKMRFSLMSISQSEVNVGMRMVNLHLRLTVGLKAQLSSVVFLFEQNRPRSRILGPCAWLTRV